jgi:hypothetical protein
MESMNFALYAEKKLHLLFYRQFKLAYMRILGLKWKESTNVFICTTVNPVLRIEATG